MPGEKGREEAYRLLVSPTCARPFEDEKREADSEGRTWIKFGGIELE